MRFIHSFHFIYTCAKLLAYQEKEDGMLVAVEQWLPLSEAARRVGVSQAKLSRMAALGEVKTKKDQKDKRKTLVDLNELNRLFYPQE